MKKILLLMSIAMLASMPSYSESKKDSFTLSIKQSSKTIQFAGCEFHVTKTNKETVRIDIQNNSNSLIVLSKDKFYEKELKKNSPSVTLDKKKFPGTKGQRRIKGIPGINEENYVSSKIILLYSKKVKAFLDIPINESIIVNIPFYIGEFKPKSFWRRSNGRNKISLTEENVLELHITIDNKDEDYIRLEKEVNDLIEELNKMPFCPNSNHPDPKHKVSLKEQEAPFKQRIEEIISEIDSIEDRRNLQRIDPEFKKYLILQDKLNNLDLDKFAKDCGCNPPPEPPICKYCRLTPKQMYDKLDDIYQKIYTGVNRKEAKMQDVNKLYSCPKHAYKWKNSDYKSKMMDRYNRIKNF